MDEKHPDYRAQETERIERLTNEDLFEALLEARCGDKQEGYSAEFCQWRFDTLYKTFGRRLRKIAFLPAKKRQN